MSNKLDEMSLAELDIIIGLLQRLLELFQSHRNKVARNHLFVGSDKAQSRPPESKL